MTHISCAHFALTHSVQQPLSYNNFEDVNFLFSIIKSFNQSSFRLAINSVTVSRIRVLVTWNCQRGSLSEGAPSADFWAGFAQTQHSIHPVHTAWHHHSGLGSGQGVTWFVSAASETSWLSPKKTSKWVRESAWLSKWTKEEANTDLWRLKIH